MVLGAIALLLAGILVAQTNLLLGGGWSGGMTRDTQRAFDMPELATAAIWPDPTKITNDGRSLFVPKIAAAPPAAAPADPPPPEVTQEQLALVAIVIAPAGKFALLRAQQSQELKQVEEGSIVGGWNLAAVEANRVILEHGDQRSILYLPDTIPENP